MPYTKKNPPTFAKNMPAGAQKIAIDTANAVLKEGGDEESAIRAAISNVKKEYKKSGDNWVPKAALVELEMIITKANVGKDGAMRWCATASDTGVDKSGDNTTLALFEDWITRTETGDGVPFLPEPRNPFLGISHYPSLDGYGEAGPTEKMYIDGKKFKTAGTFYDDDEHPIGKALFEALIEERAAIKKGEAIDEPMRISAAWWDIQHAHGDFVFTRKNLTDKCPMCEKGAAKTYLKGQVDHWAVTRVPMNPRTDLELQEKAEMAKKTRKEDAASIIGTDRAEELDERSLIGKSDAEDTPEAMVIKTEDEEAAPETPDTQKTDEGMMERPFGGATDLTRARQWIAEQDKLNTTMDYWQMFDMVMMNILESEDGDKMEMMKKAISDFSEQVDTIKAGLSDMTMMSLVSKPEPLAERSDGEMSEQKTTPAAEETQEAAPQQDTQSDVFDQLREEVNAAIASAEGREQATEAIQKSFTGIGQVVKGQLDAKYPPNVEQMAEEAAQKAVAPLAEKMDLMLAKMNQAPAQAQPVQKSYTHPVEQLNPAQPKPQSLRDMVRKSVGLPQ